MATRASVESSAARRGPRVVTCESYGPVQIPLAEVLEPSGRLRLNPDIQHGDYFAVSLRGGALTLRARGYVGYIPLNEDVVVHVKPRVPVSNLSRIVKLAGEPPTALTSIREYATTEEWSDSLLDIYARTLIRHVDTIATSGLMREYARREEVSSFPKGRVLLHPSIQRLFPRGIHHRVQVAWFERTVDVPANRCLKYAIWTLARRYMSFKPKDVAQRRIQRTLNAIFALFDGVELDNKLRFMDDPVVQGSQPLPALRSYYRDALSVSVAIIQQRAVLIDSLRGSVRMPSIVLNMNAVFEAYVRNVLRLHAQADKWVLEVKNGNDEGKKDLFNEKPSEEATPDIVLAAPDGSFPLVLEVKNVPIRAFFSDRDAIAQVVTYALSYRTKRVVLIHPRLSAFQIGGMCLLGILDDVEVHQYRFDLGAENLEDEEASFAEAVAALLSTPSALGA